MSQAVDLMSQMKFEPCSRAEEQRLRSLMARVKLNGAGFLISSFL